MCEIARLEGFICKMKKKGNYEERKIIYVGW